MAKRNYDEEAKLLSQAINLAIEAFRRHIPSGWPPEQVEHFVTVYTDFDTDLLTPQPKYHNLQSLKYIEDAAFTYFQEGSGIAVNYFWQQIKAHALPYKRQNRMAKILKKQKIRNQMEYDFVTDTMVAYLQDDMITQAEASQLESYLHAYDDKMSKKKS
jgi:hypothetical protein